MTVHLATVTRVEGAGVYVEIMSVAPGREFGPSTCAYLGPSLGDRVLLAPLDGVADQWAVLSPA